MIDSGMRELTPKEIERVKRIDYMMEHWDKLPPLIAGKIDGIIMAVSDMVPLKPEDRKTEQRAKRKNARHT